MAALRIRVRGQVQGVGFRPFVWRLARERGVCGDVSNDAEGVLIHAQAPDLSGFLDALESEAPPLARIEAVEPLPSEERIDLTDFRIAETGGGAARTEVTPDAMVCPACRAEIADPAERRPGRPWRPASLLCAPRHRRSRQCGNR